jgi:hypothetical protein
VGVTLSRHGLPIPAFKVREQWRFKRADIDACIERQKYDAHKEIQ